MNFNLPLHHQCVVDVVETKEMLGYHQFVGRGELFCQDKEHGELNLDKNKAKFQFFQTTHTLTYLQSNKVGREDLQNRFWPPKGSFKVTPNVKFSKPDIYEKAQLLAWCQVGKSVADIVKISGRSQCLVQRLFALKAALPRVTPGNVLPARKAGSGRPRKMTPNIVLPSRGQSERWRCCLPATLRPSMSAFSVTSSLPRPPFLLELQTTFFLEERRGWLVLARWPRMFKSCGQGGPGCHEVCEEGSLKL